MRGRWRGAAAGALVFATSCSNGATSSTPNVVPVNITQTAKLQLAVGTATIGYPGGAVVGTNFVTTFRAADGHSATLSNTPTLRGPAGFGIGFGGSNAVTGVLPNAFNAAVLAASKGAQYPLSFGATLGPFIGVFGYGMAADNLVSSQVALEYGSLVNGGGVCSDLNSLGPNTEVDGNNTPITSEAQSEELGLPLGINQGLVIRNNFCPLYPLNNVPPVQTSPNTALPINYYGGPPAWPSGVGYGQPSFFIGYPLGFTDFAAAPVAGTYALDVAYATNQTSTTYGHSDAQATLRTTTALPPIIISGATATSGGTGSVTLTVPAGLFETIVFVRAPDCDPVERPNALPDNYAIITHSSGTQSFVFAANLGPPNDAGQPTPTFCGPAGVTNATAFAVGFDYPAYESSYPFNVSQTPAIANAAGQADVTTSAPFPVSSL